MARPLPKWIMRNYAKLWKHFQQREFSFSEAQEFVEENTSVILSFLKKNSWLGIRLHPEDSRKLVYRLKSPEKAMEEIANEEEKNR